MSARPDWKEVVDTSSGKTYYYNRKTRETSWSPPAEGFEAAAGKKKKKAAAAAASTSSSSPQETNSTAGPGAGSTTGGGQAEGGAGGSTTGGTAGGSTTGAGDDDGSPLPPDWKRVTDPSTGKPYYYNKRTKVTSWKRPAAEEAENTTAAAAAAPAGGSTSAAGSTTGGPQNTSDPGADDAASSVAGGTTGGGTAKKRRQRTGEVSADGQWEQVVDPGTGKKYWYNKVTKATAWVLPSSAGRPSGDDEKDDGGARAAAPAAGGGGLARSSSVQSSSAESSVAQGDAMERPSDRMMRLKQAMQQQQQQQAGGGGAGGAGGAGGGGGPSDGEDDDEDDPSHEFRFSKHRHGWFNRTFRVGSVADEETLLQFKKSLIKKALLKKNRDMDAEAVQAFKNIMNYMGDRKTSKPPIENAKKLLANAMSHPSGLRDEIYLQLVKQTSKNPKVTSTIKGFELLNFCLCCFPPSKALKKFLVAHFKQVLEDPGTDATARRLLEQAQQTLEVVIGMGQRKEVPSETELNCIREGKPVPIRINLVNGTFKTLQVSSFTTAKDVEGQMSAKLNLTLHSPFALYESSAADDNKERIVEAKERVLDIMSAWERAPETEEIKETVPGGGKKDVRIRIVERPRFNQFSFKAKLVLKTSDPDVLADPEAVNLLYLQAIHDIVTWRYPVKEKDVTVLAALQLQASFGDWQEEAHVPGWLAPKLPEFMPTHLLESKKGVRSDQLAAEWEATILQKYAKIQGFTSLEAKLNYLDYVTEWAFYGATFFTVEQRQFRDYPSPIQLGITCEGVILMHPQKRTLLENYSYAEIVTWGHSDERFIVVVGNIVQQRKLIFKTSEGKAANGLIHDYVKFKVKSKLVT